MHAAIIGRFPPKRIAERKLTIARELPALRQEARLAPNILTLFVAVSAVSAGRKPLGFDAASQVLL